LYPNKGLKYLKSPLKWGFFYAIDYQRVITN